jgi:ATP-dependent Lon protease
MSDFREIVVRRPGMSDFVFSGRLLAEASCPAADLSPRKARDSWVAQRDWTHLRIYALTDTRFLAVAEDYNDLRNVVREIRACRDAAELIDFLGQSDLAKSVYMQLRIDAAEHPDENDAESSSDKNDEFKGSDAQPQPAAAVENLGLPVVTIADREQMEKKLKTAKQHGYRRLQSALERLRDSGTERHLAQVEQDSLSRLNGLETRFPNLAEVITHFRRHLSLCMLSEQHVLRMDPLLLVGGAGLGKTKLVQEIAKALSAEFYLVNCAATTAGFTLSGLDASWAEGRPGRIFEALCTGRTANPLILLDEIDKMRGDARYDAYGPLYTLLEPTTAKRFIDECLTLELDCSHIIWIATANNAEIMPDPILSRVTRIDVRPPTGQEMRAIASSVYRDLLESEPWASAFAERLSDDVLSEIASLAPRVLRRTLLDAAAAVAAERASQACTNHRLTISASDIRKVLPKSRARTLGFRSALDRAA